MRVLLLVLLFACGRDRPQITVGVAASLRHAMPELSAKYGEHVEVTYGASDTIAAKLGVFDCVVLAEAPEKLGVTLAHAQTIATTSLVLVGPAGETQTFATLGSSGAKIAIGDPATVPAGRYARDYLQAIGVWDAIVPRLVYGGDVAGVLAHAQRGTARVAIVYRTDALHAQPLAILDAPQNAPIVNIVAGVVGDNARARAFVDFLASRDGQAILARHGFTR